MKKRLGILGGMGPMATADLYRKIVELTDADSDNGHIRVIIDSNTAIPDRTSAILSGGQDPVPEMLSAAENLISCGAECIIMPCNTAHYFLPRLQPRISVPILDMTKITAERCSALYPGKKAAVLATRGTLASGVYARALEGCDVPYIVPDDKEQDVLMHLIYDVVKASRPMDPVKDLWSSLLEGLREKGADLFLLACTELPILSDHLAVPGPFIDPTRELAKAAIEYCGYHVRG